MAGMSALEQAVRKAVALHQTGNLDAAQAAYTTILRQHPRDPNALMNLSTLYIARGKLQDGLAMLRRMIGFYPKLPQPHFSYGNAMMQQNLLGDAIAAFDRTLDIDPNFIEAYHNRGLAQTRLMRFAEALESFDQALARDPNHVSSYRNRVSALNYLRRFEEVLAALEHPLVTQHPDRGWTFRTRAIALQELGRLDEALGFYDLAVADNSGDAENYSHRANGYNHKHEYARALADIDQAIALGAASGFIHNIRAVALNALGRFEEAAQHYREVIRRAPDMQSAYWNLGLILLLLGQYGEGLPLYEWRWKEGAQKGQLRDDGTLLWQGEPLDGKSICVQAEQGLGDFIQCLRYVPLLLARGARLVLETPPPLLALTTENFANEKVTVVKADSPLPPTDFHCPIMSLPLAFGITRPEEIPNQVPYLTVRAEKAAEWGARLGPKTKLRVGLVWSGGPRHVYDHLRSITLEMLQPLLQQNTEFHCLQKEFRKHDLPYLNLLQVHDQAIQDFTDTAALIAQMDVVVSVDTSVAHLAGALGKKLFVLLPYVPDYRWLLAREDSVLYPTARLFRQRTKGDWAEVLTRVGAALEAI